MISLTSSTGVQLQSDLLRRWFKVINPQLDVPVHSLFSPFFGGGPRQGGGAGACPARRAGAKCGAECACI